MGRANWERSGARKGWGGEGWRGTELAAALALAEGTCCSAGKEGVKKTQTD